MPPPTASEFQPPASAVSESIEKRCQAGIEFVMMLAIVASPWAFGCASGRFEFFLVCGVAVVLLLTSVWMLCAGVGRWRGGPTAWWFLGGLVGLATVAAIQLAPLPTALVGALAPGVDQWSEPAGLLESSDLPTASGDASAVRANRLGLNPGGSYAAMVRLLLIAGIFVSVMMWRDARSCLRRLSIVAAVVGTALAIFGLAQHFGSHDGLVYWTVKVESGLGFGPFINRNHYPFFMNLTLGLTAGLLIERLQGFGQTWPRRLFSDPAVGWLLVAVSFMIASLIACVSRGGVLSAMIAVGVVCMIRLRQAKVARSIVIAAAIGFPVAMVLGWVGFELQESRLNMLAQSDRYTMDGRWHLWRAALISVPEFPWFGSGGETYQYWETIHQGGDPDWNSWQSQSLRADNEFVDVLCEYGVFGLAGLVAMALSAGFAAVRRCRDSGLAAGAAMGVLAVLLHSVVDFGLRVPATAVLAVVTTGLLMAQPRGQHSRSGGSSSRSSSQSSGLRSSSQRSSGHRDGSRRSAKRAGLPGEPTDGRSPDRSTIETSSQPSTETAGAESISPSIATPSPASASLAPTASGRPALASSPAWSSVGKTAAGIALIVISMVAIRSVRRDRDADLDQRAAVQAVQQRRPMTAVRRMVDAIGSAPQSVPMRLDLVRAAQIAMQSSTNEETNESLRSLILDQSSETGQLCPIVWQPFAWAAQYRIDGDSGAVATDQRAIELLTHARRLHPSEPDLAFLLGRLLWQRGGQDPSALETAAPHWRDSLRVSTTHLSDILALVDGWSPERIADELLPADPVVTLAAATVTVTAPSVSDATRELLLRRTLMLIEFPERTDRKLTVAESEQLRSRVLESLGRSDDAIDALRLAINASPENIGWRIRLANLLIDQQRYNEATSEIRVLLSLSPKNRTVESLQKKLSQLKAAGGVID